MATRAVEESFFELSHVYFAGKRRVNVPISPTLSLHRAPVQTIAIAGGKGGVGKSNVAVNLAAALGSGDHEVLLVDGDLDLGNIDQLLNLRPDNSLCDVFAGICTLDDVVLQGPRGVSVIPSASGVMEMAHLSHIEYAGLIGLFSELPTDADTLIIDVATGLSESVLSFCRAVREVVIVVVDEPTALHDAFSTIRVLHQRCHVHRFRIVANKTESSRHGLDLYGALADLTERHLDVLLDYCGSVPLDAQLKQAVRQRRSVVEAFPRSPAALAFRKLAARVARWPQPQAPCGHIEFFIERLIDVADGTR
ncbi:MAG: P-loop NTPase [Granulosicoccus sp.]|nr:P-loop NTPase [Granulosicoccus sp.]